MTMVADFRTGDGTDWYAMAQAVIAAGADENEDRMSVEDWLSYGDIDDTDSVEKLAADYNQEHDTWRKADEADEA